jgi:GT2 family glycosyltransferase
VGIVICTLDRCEAVLRALSGLAGQVYPPDRIGVWVHDDGSGDDTPRAVPGFLSGLKEKGFYAAAFHVSDARRGIAHARNITAAKAMAASDLVLFLDDDVILDKDCVAGLSGYIMENPKTGVVAPRMIRSDDGELLHGAYFVDWLTFTYRMKDGRDPLPCDWLDPACLMATPGVIETIGGFWPGYYRSHEGVDFCLRAKRAGCGVVYLPAASAVHIMRQERLSPERVYYVIRNKFTLIRRNGSALHRWLLIPLLAAAGLPKYIFESFMRNGWTAPREMGFILKAVVHGLLGRTGPLQPSSEEARRR